MEASIMNDNVIAFPRSPVEIADAERAARLDRIIADLDALSEDTRGRSVGRTSGGQSGMLPP
jgi:hypothetical protein